MAARLASWLVVAYLHKLFHDYQNVYTMNYGTYAKLMQSWESRSSQNDQCNPPSDYSLHFNERLLWHSGITTGSRHRRRWQNPGMPFETFLTACKQEKRKGFGAVETKMMKKKRGLSSGRRSQKLLPSKGESCKEKAARGDSRAKYTSCRA